MMMNKRFVVVDLETTGHSPKQGDQIIQFAAVVVENGRIVERFSTFLNPNIPIPPFISQLTNIHQKMVEDAPTFEDISEKIIELLEDAYFVAHNVAFDLNFLQESLAQSGYDKLYPSTVDTVELARMLLPTVEGYKLNQLAEYLNLNHDQPHQADSDAEVTAKILLLLMEKLNSLPLATLKQLYTLSLHLKSEIGELIQGIMNEKQDDYHEGYDFVHGLALRKQRPVVKPSEVLVTYEEFQEQRETLASVFSSFEKRTGQEKMMNAVHESLMDNEHALIEAGTGIGKTIAYLIPSAFYAQQHKKPVVVSTHTVTLQQQLMERDIPMLKKLMPFELSAAILKGREHYLSIRKFNQFLKERNHNYDVILTKAKLLIWLTETDTGDVDEINLPSGGKLFWEQLNESNPSHLDFKHPWNQYSFYNRAQERAAQAQIIITNHRLLLLDVVSKRNLLPSYEQVVIDEAHHFDTIASEELGGRLDYFSIHALLSRIGLLDDKGLLNKVHKLCQKHDIRLNTKKLEEMLEKLRIECDDLFRLVHAYVMKKNKQTDSEIGRVSYRYNVQEENTLHWHTIQEQASRVRFLMNDILSLLHADFQVMDSYQEQLTKREQSHIHELTSAIEQFHHLSSEFADFFFQPHLEEVTWIEIEPKGAANATFLYRQPLSVADTLADTFFAKKQSVILTSATLTVNHSFSYIIEQLGLYDFQPLQMTIPSPFDYRSQAKVYIPKDMPAVNDVTLEEYSAIMAESILDIASITKGRMLVLFTSYEMLKMTYQYMKELNDLEEFVILGQGVTTRNRNRLLKDFAQFSQSILLGTNSLWEGIDLPGELVSSLIIVRLPFASPRHPFLKAKFEQLRKEGKNPFMDYSLPQAVIRFKQGFGRLIRTKQDKGSIFILDNRMITTMYGSHFLHSLPDVDIVSESFSVALHDFEAWWTSKKL
ncbi:ATP-dependent DNA helicase DinG [Priestia flexa]|uniref:ATP-dependent DNA helicase DinG n=1 Tax=Priestia flexa TaxID=86664 RepID=UPI001EED11A1|nr:ATP-dependent DNA helicase DinG [Priestia flexa]